MQQDRVHARAELGADSFSNLASLSLSLTSDEFAATYAKALERPEDRPFMPGWVDSAIIEIDPESNIGFLDALAKQQ